MADVDIDPFGDHESRPEETMGENIPLTPGGGPTWEPEREQETSFRGESEVFKEKRVKELYQLLGNKTQQRLEPRLDLFELGEDGRLYYKGKPLTNRNGELKMVGEIVKTLGIRELREMGFIILETNLKPQHVLDLLEKRVKLPSTSDIAKADDIELQEIMENITKSTENLISQMKHNQSQMDDLFKYLLRELLGLDKQLRSIRGSLKVEVAKKVQLEQHIERKKCKLT